MNKNLKKVISAASALAVSATGVAAFAADYPDVPNTANYYQAVNELSALNVINGYDDGTFKPEENVTRAQIAKMVVTALGNTVANAAESAKGKDTQFTDVPGSHWAAGYVSVATTSAAQNFINGYSATTFGPEDNVTYAQAVKMLVAALGYSTLAERDGGWPSGYLKYGISLGLSNGITGVNNDQQLNRAQVAVLIDNAIKAPIAVAGTNVLGQAVVIPKDGSGDLDGTKDGYQNLLNYAHDAYLVYGRVTGTFKTGTTSDVNDVKFRVEKSDNWEGYSVNASKNKDAVEETMKKGSLTDADSYLFSYAQAIIQKDSNDEYTLVAVTPYGTSEKIEKNMSDYNLFKDGSSNDIELRIWKDSNKSKYDTYKLANDTSSDVEKVVKIYVNGKEFGEGIDIDFVNGSGTMTLIDAPDQGKSSSDGKYDYIMVSYYVNGIVDEVSEKTDELKVYFDDCEKALEKGMTLDLDADDKEYNVYLDGKKVDYSEIKEGDVLSVAYDVDGSFDNSDSYDIYISRNTVEGKVTSSSSDSDKLDREYTLDSGDVYKLAYSDVSEPTNGNTYTLYLNTFGKIVKAEEMASSKKYGLLENVYTSNGGADRYADIVTADGSKQSFAVKKDDYDTFVDILMKDNDKFDTDDKLANRNDIKDRVIAYNVNGKGEVTLKDYTEATSTAGATGVAGVEIKGDYKASNGRLDGKQLSENYSSILDLSDYDEDSSKSYSKVAMSSLTDGNAYEGWAFGRSESSTKDYQFVLVTSGIGGFNVDSKWAVYVNSGSTTTDANGTTDAVIAYVNGELKTIPTDVDVDLKTGDVFFYKTDSDGLIDEYRTVAEVPTTYQDLFKLAINNKFDILNSTTASQFAGEASKDNFGQSGKDDNELISGFIVDAGTGSVTLAKSSDIEKAGGINAFDTSKAKDYDIDSDAVITGYDYSAARLVNRVDRGSSALVRSVSFERSSYQNNDKDSGIVDFEKEYATISAESNENYGNVYFAVAKVVDGDITEMVVYTPSDKTE